LELAAKTGRIPEDLVEDAMAGYPAEISEVRETIENCYDDFKNGRVKPIDGKAFFERLRKRERKNNAARIAISDPCNHTFPPGV
jgi:hypothetical protein